LARASVLKPSWWIIYALLTLSVLSFVIVVVYCTPVIFGRFYPSFSAFSFPFVVTSIAYTDLSQSLMPELAPVATMLQIAVTLLVMYVLVRYLIYLFEPQK
jgi:exfoliative toxin A/B